MVRWTYAGGCEVCTLVDGYPVPGTGCDVMGVTVTETVDVDGRCDSDLCLTVICCPVT